MGLLDDYQNIFGESVRSGKMPNQEDIIQQLLDIINQSKKYL